MINKEFNALLSLSHPLDWLADSQKNNTSVLILIGMSLLLMGCFRLLSNLVFAGKDFIDSKFSYLPETAYQIIEEYTPLQRNTYIISALTLDVIFPVIYSSLFAVILTGLLRHLDLSTTFWYSFRFFPFLAGFIDILENINISIVVIQYPQRINIIAHLASLCTSTKWVLLGLTVGMILILILMNSISVFKPSRL